METTVPVKIRVVTSLTNQGLFYLLQPGNQDNHGNSGCDVIHKPRSIESVAGGYNINTGLTHSFCHPEGIT